jgi:hypothetical protein
MLRAFVLLAVESKTKALNVSSEKLKNELR